MIQLINKISNIVKRAVVTKSGGDDQGSHTCHCSFLGKDTVVEQIYPYGMSANAPVGCVVLSFSVGGNEANQAGIPYSQQIRFSGLKSGEVVFGNPLSRSYIKFDEDGNIEIYSKKDIKIKTEEKISIEAKNIEIKSEDFKLESNAMSFSSGSFSFGFDTSGVFSGDGKFNFGVGGQAIARVGDEVTVGGNVGTITSGSTNNTSA